MRRHSPCLAHGARRPKARARRAPRLFDRWRRQYRRRWPRRPRRRHGRRIGRRCASQSLRPRRFGGRYRSSSAAGRPRPR
ncbi:MAG TPA: hypothetical protein DCZ49_08875 [Hyphomonadaceae bacterium]|nr:hypothetical protein [Hyphomonadaceae bacterium]